MKIILIAGPSGSGKTTIAKMIQRELSTSYNCHILSCDNYYNDLSDLSMEERNKLNYDLPTALEWPRLLIDVDMLSRGETCEIPTYDFAQHNRSTQTQTITAPDILIIESIHVLYNSELRDRADCTIFVDASKEACLERRTKRDQKERGRSPESIKTQFETQVWPACIEYILPLKSEASHIIPNHQQTSDIDISVILQEFQAEPTPRLRQGLFAAPEANPSTHDITKPKLAM